MTFFTVAGDLALTANGRRFVRGGELERIAKAITVGFQIFRGTWQYDTRKGIPYFEDVFGTGRDLSKVRSVFHEFLSGIRGVAAVDYVRLTFDRAERTISVAFSVRTSTGQTLQDERVIGQA